MKWCLMVKVFLFIAVVMLPSAACLIYGWISWRSRPSESRRKDWRIAAPKLGWCSATVSQVLTFAFLLQGFHPDRQSFAEPQPLAWQFANWITVSTWLFALLTVVLAKKAPIRRSLLVWGLITPLAAWIVVMMGFGLGGDKNYDTREFVQHSLAAYRIEILRIGRNG